MSKVLVIMDEEFDALVGDVVKNMLPTDLSDIPLADEETCSMVRQIVEDRNRALNADCKIDVVICDMVGDPNFFENEARSIREAYALTHVKREIGPICYPVQKNYTHPRSPRESFRSQRGRK